MERIRSITIPAFAREPSVTAEEAVLYLIDRSSIITGSEIIEMMTERFVPSFTESEVQEAISKLLSRYQITLTIDRFLRRVVIVE